MKQPFIVGMLHLLPADRRLEMEESQTVITLLLFIKDIIDYDAP